jgi:hypothetical protein
MAPVLTLGRQLLTHTADVTAEDHSAASAQVSPSDRTCPISPAAGHQAPTHHHVYTTTNSGAGRLGETATVAEDRCIGGRKLSGDSKSRDKNAAQRDCVSPTAL